MLPDEDQNDERADREQHRGRDGESEDETRRLLHAGRTRARALTDGGERTQGGSLAAFALAVRLTVLVPLIAVLAVGVPVAVPVARAVGVTRVRRDAGARTRPFIRRLAA